MFVMVTGQACCVANVLLGTVKSCIPRHAEK